MSSKNQTAAEPLPTNGDNSIIPYRKPQVAGGGGPGNNDMFSRIIKLELKFDALDEKVGRIGTAVRGLQTDMTSVKLDIASVKDDTTSVKGDMASTRGDIASMKSDINWIKWLGGLAVTAIIGIMSVMGSKILDLMQQLVTR